MLFPMFYLLYNLRQSWNGREIKPKNILINRKYITDELGIEIVYTTLYPDWGSQIHMNILLKNYLTMIFIPQSSNRRTIKKQVLILHFLHS